MPQPAPMSPGFVVNAFTEAEPQGIEVYRG
jgi:hypothetical protein